MFFCQNNTVSRILVLAIFDAWGISFSSYFGKFFKVKWLHSRFLCKRSCSDDFLFSRIDLLYWPIVNSADSAFSFWLYSSEWKSGIHGNFQIYNQLRKFLSNWKICHNTNFGGLEWIPLRCFSFKTIP